MAKKKVTIELCVISHKAYLHICNWHCYAALCNQSSFVRSRVLYLIRSYASHRQ